MSFTRLGVALLVVSVVGPARADPPVTTVFFGAPALELETIESAPAVPAEPQACPRAVEIERRMGGARERMHLPLLECDGSPSEAARRALSVLARPRTRLEAPSEEEMREWRESGADPRFLAEDVRLVHPALLERLQRIGEAFDRPIEILSGYRPHSPEHSRHHHGRALDIVVRDVPRESLRDLAVSLPETGVGWYPNSVFVHVDVRSESAYWVDESAPGAAPSYARGDRDEDPLDDRAERDAPSAEEIERLRRETRDVLRGIRLEAPPTAASPRRPS